MAIVNNRSEKLNGERLTQAGIENYVPTQTPSYIFRLMTNKTGTTNNAGGKPLAIVSEVEIKRLKFRLAQSDVPVTIVDHCYKPGDKVRIIRGSLARIEGEIYEHHTSESEVYVAFEYFGCAHVLIDTVSLKPIK